MLADFPQQYRGESADGAEPEKWKIKTFSWAFIIVMSQNGQEAGFAGMCDNVHVRSRYGKIEQPAEREGRRASFISFSMSLPSISH